MPEDPCWPNKEKIDEFGLSIEGDGSLLVQPGDPLWRNLSQEVQNKLFNSLPAFIVSPKSVHSLQKTLTFAREYKIRPTIISTGVTNLTKKGHANFFSHILIARI